MNNGTKFGIGLIFTLLFALYIYRIKDINIFYISIPFPFLGISLTGIEKKWKSKQLKGLFRYLAPIALVAITLFSLFVTIPVHGTLIATHEFYNPLGSTESSSFEYVGSSVLEPPPGWNVTGGMRYLPEVNDDGKIDGKDIAIVAMAFGTCGPNYLGEGKPATPGWNPVADLNGDNKIDGKDIGIEALRFGKVTHALDGHYSWWIGGPGDWYMSRYVENYCLPALGGAFVFGFWYLADQLYSANGSCRAEIVLSTTEGDILDYTGVWTVPIMNNWTAVYFNGYSCTNVQSIQVIIHVQNASACIDCATVSMVEDDKYEGEYGSLAVGVSVFSYKKTIGPTLDGMVIAVPSIYAEAADGYKIKWIELKVINFYNCTFNLNIPYCAQGNDKAYKVDPAAIEEQDNDRLFAAGIIIPIVVTGVLTFGIGAIPEVAAAGTMGIVSRFVVSSTFNAALKFILPHFASDPDHKTADGGGQGDAVWENWPYPSTSPNKDDFVNSANAAYDLNWAFATGSSTCFGVNIKASVCFAEPVHHTIPYPPGSYWTLDDRATYTQQVGIYIGPIS